MAAKWNVRWLGALLALVVVAVIAARCVFTVSEGEQAVRTRFGAILDSTYQPGLHWKLPWDFVVRIDRRTLAASHADETFLTNDNRGLIVDFYILWRVSDASAYFQATGASEDVAAERLSDIVKDGIKSIVAQRTLEQIVTAERSVVTGQVMDSASRTVAALGIKLVDVRVQAINLPDEVSASVYESMKQNFAKIASQLRAEGRSSAASIRAGAERQSTEIVASAEQGALGVRGSADEQVADIYAKAYSAYPDFYAFYRSLQAYERSLGKDGDVLVLSPDSEFFKYFKSPGQAPGRSP
ncbi:MAG TPA: protease modulator HflC [Steroidobacteraceae bacterium]|jgi:membrane protease subunit HflC